jgi:indole-3-glycerol phosphate synthase
VSAFTEALRGASTPVIMEVKRRGADGEDLLAGRPVREIVDSYHRLGAPCLSVVTGPWFGGDDGLLREVAALTDRPILKKDFIATDRQIVDARAMGAAAVLLTADLLPSGLTARLASSCRRYAVTPFVEITTAAQLEALGDARGCVVAVNNKDIRQRERGEPQIERSLDLLPAIRRSGADLAVSASGIADPDVAARLLGAGFDALLIGTGLLTAGDPQGWLDAVTTCHPNSGGRGS